METQEKTLLEIFIQTKGKNFIQNILTNEIFNSFSELDIGFGNKDNEIFNLNYFDKVMKIFLSEFSSFCGIKIKKIPKEFDISKETESLKFSEFCNIFLEDSSILSLEKFNYLWVKLYDRIVSKDK
jgi:hypothetical protein